MRLGFVFRSYPHSSAKGREGLDALLAASAYCDDIDVFFIGAGITQLLKEQHPSNILSRDYIAAFKLLELYDIENVFVCQSSLLDYQITPENLLIETTLLSHQEIAKKLQHCHKIMTF
ncbi:sulfurtransferase complex subunit TusC [Vibrio rumoiensis]|uniref:Protein TusC homolog n=1 Tax=Vibrio rumoiensis TaxID=76258 RepID=A0ABW7J0A9_9VIBR